MTGRVEGKIAVVLGAGSVGPGWGNGRASAVFLAREGAKVVAADLKPESLLETMEKASECGAGDNVETATLDATNSEQIKALLDETKEKYGRVDILVNVIGGSSHGGVAELTEENWHKQLDYNLTSVFLGCKHVIPIMKEQGGGSIVSIASVSGIRFTGSPQVGYAASKAGVIQLTKVTAVQYAPDQIRVNVVVPGQVHTPLVEARLAGQRAGGDLDLLLTQRQARIPLGWMGDGRDIAGAVLYFASDESRFVTGAELVVDGGMVNRVG